MSPCAVTVTSPIVARSHSTGTWSPAGRSPRCRPGLADGVAHEDRYGAHGRVAAPFQSGGRRVTPEVDAPATVGPLPAGQSAQLRVDAFLGEQGACRTVRCRGEVQRADRFVSGAAVDVHQAVAGDEPA